MSAHRHHIGIFCSAKLVLALVLALVLVHQVMIIRAFFNVQVLYLS